MTTSNFGTPVMLVFSLFGVFFGRLASPLADLDGLRQRFC
jgi:hypothetical protein